MPFELKTSRLKPVLCRSLHQICGRPDKVPFEVRRPHPVWRLGVGQRLTIRRHAQAFPPLFHQAFPFQQCPDRTCRRPCFPRTLSLQVTADLPRPPVWVFPPDRSHPFGHLLGQPMHHLLRRTAPLCQPSLSRFAEPLQPLVCRLTRDGMSGRRPPPLTVIAQSMLFVVPKR